MDNIIVEKVFVKENDGVRINSNDSCAVFLLHDFELEQFTWAIKGNMLSPIFQSTPIEILAPCSEIWNLVICFQGSTKNIRYSTEKIAFSD